MISLSIEYTESPAKVRVGDTFTLLKNMDEPEVKELFMRIIPAHLGSYQMTHLWALGNADVVFCSILRASILRRDRPSKCPPF